MGISIADITSVCRPALLIPRMTSRYPMLSTSKRDLKMYDQQYEKLGKRLSIINYFLHSTKMPKAARIRF